MKKITHYILAAAMLMFCLGGCGGPAKEPSDSSDTEYLSNISIDSDAWVDSDAWGRDNSLDAYSAAVNVPLSVEMPENALGAGGRQLFLGSDRAYLFIKHLMQTARESWDGLYFAAADGEQGSQRFDYESQLYGIGPVAGTNHYVAYGYEMLENGEDKRYFLTERDENHKTVKETPLDFQVSPADSLVLPSYLAVDSSGIIHLVQEVDGHMQYLLVSPEGECLSSMDIDVAGLVPLYDGRIAFWEYFQDSAGGRRTELKYMDRENGTPVRLAALKVRADYVTLFDESTLLYADGEGIYRSSLSGENPEPLYRWINHGIEVVPRGTLALRADEKGEIALIYRDSENYNYLCLKPTTEEVELCGITLAADMKYKRIVAAFNRRYPRWHIELKDDYDETALLTQLGAGDGPVLIDTGRRNFEFQELEKLWEPLDSVMGQLGITEELVPSALGPGKVNGIQYGVAADFFLHTLLTGNQDLKGWDYPTFLQCIADAPELEAVFNVYEGGNYGTNLITGYLLHGIDDAYFWDAQAGTTNFDSSEFRLALELAKKYCSPKEAVPAGSSLQEGKVLCNSLIISDPKDIAGIRICYGENANYIGFPTKDGSAHYIGSSSLLAIRRTATKEEKEAAVAFLDLLLSYEGQQLMAEDINFNMSVRRDMLEEQIAAMNEDTEVELGDFGSFALGNQVNRELDRMTLLRLVDMAEPAEFCPRKLRNILYEELEQYFSGDLTEKVLIKHLNSRVRLYLGERM